MILDALVGPDSQAKHEARYNAAMLATCFESLKKLQLLKKQFGPLLEHRPRKDSHDGKGAKTHIIISLDPAARPASAYCPMKGNWEMAAKPARPAWKRHELVSRAIFEALLKQSNAENLEVKHNVSKKGLKTAHQIDVFWKFRIGGLDHSVIVQVKKKKGRAKKCISRDSI